MGTYHVLPVDDLMEHAEDEDCTCGPQILHETAGDGSDSWIVVHHSLDGREAYEAG